MGKVFSVEQKSKVLGDLQTITDFTNDEIMEYYKKFVNGYPTGKITLEEFKKEYANHFPKGNTSELAALVFRTFDRNADGKIDFREFMCCASVSCKGTLEQKLNWAFRMFDLDGNGYICMAEMLETVIAIYKSIGPRVVTLEDQATPETQTTRLFQQLDTNQDGKLSLDEFVEGGKKSSTIQQILLACNPIDSS